MTFSIIDLELTYYPIIISYLSHYDALSLSLTNKYINKLYQDNYNIIYQDRLIDRKSIVNEILYLEYGNVTTTNALSYIDTNSICRRLEGLNHLTHTIWQRWDFEMNEDPTEQTSDNEGIIIFTVIIIIIIILIITIIIFTNSVE